jgi:hypothetical protein
MLFRRGSSATDVDFVRELPGLGSVRLNGDIRDCSAVFDVPSLRRLDLLHCRPPLRVEFDRLSLLESLDFSWGPVGGETIAALPALRNLYLAAWNGDRLPFAEKMPLRSLRLETQRHATVLLADLAAVADVIEEVDIDSAVLSVDGDRIDFPALHSLTLENCRVPDLAFLAGAAALRRLSLENCAAVASLSDLASLPNLETLIINGNTHIVDGDLQVLFRMPALRQVAIERGRPNYNRKPAEIRQSFPLAD